MHITHRLVLALQHTGSRYAVTEEHAEPEDGLMGQTLLGHSSLKPSLRVHEAPKEPGQSALNGASTT